MKDIEDILESTNSTTDKMESLIINLNNISHVIPPERYFLTRILHLLERGKK